MIITLRYLMKFGAVFAVLTSGCAKVGDFPSLAKRPFETNAATGTLAPITKLENIQPEIASDPALTAKLAVISSRARNSALPFATNYAIAQRSVSAASSASPGSEAWVTAQLAISRLEPLRSPAQSALVSMDEESKRTERGVSTSDRALIAATRAEALAIADAQTAQVQALVSRLRTR